MPRRYKKKGHNFVYGSESYRRDPYFEASTSEDFTSSPKETDVKYDVKPPKPYEPEKPRTDWEGNPIASEEPDLPEQPITDYIVEPVDLDLLQEIMLAKEEEQPGYRQLPEFEGYTIDERLQEFRKVDWAEQEPSIDFTPFESPKGQAIFDRMYGQIETDQDFLAKAAGDWAVYADPIEAFQPSETLLPFEATLGEPNFGETLPFEEVLTEQLYNIDSQDISPSEYQSSYDSMIDSVELDVVKEDLDETEAQETEQVDYNW